MEYTVIYYETKTGKCPVQGFINSRKEKNQVKIINQIELLEDFGPQLPRPYADLLQDGIHELRIKLSGNQFRVLYFFIYRNYIVLTHAFNKTTSKVPKPEIKKAKSARKDFMGRYKSVEDIKRELKL